MCYCSALVILIRVEGEGVSSFLEDWTTCMHPQCATTETRAGGCLYGRHHSLNMDLEVATPSCTVEPEESYWVVEPILVEQAARVLCRHTTVQ
jgi:hypothetical protein